MTKKVITGSGNDLAPKRRQAITWTNDDPVQWSIYASPSLREFIYKEYMVNIIVIIEKKSTYELNYFKYWVVVIGLQEWNMRYIDNKDEPQNSGPVLCCNFEMFSNVLRRYHGSTT